MRGLLQALLFVLVILGLIAVFDPHGRHDHNVAKKTACVSNVKQNALALITYASDFDEHFPTHDWMDSAVRNLKTENILRCPETGKSGPDIYGYALNTLRLGANLRTMNSPEKAILLFDSKDLAKNVVGDESLMPKPGRHHGVNSVGYADGHVKFTKN
jgi:hypothetical protein